MNNILFIITGSIAASRCKEIITLLRNKEVKINNFEGFIRQVIGWREYQRMLYQLDYQNQISSNHFGNIRKLNKKWYEGTTGVKPIDDTIKK